MSMSETLPIYRTSVSPSWIDYNGHMGDYAYGIVFSDAATAYMDRIGIDAAYREVDRFGDRAGIRNDIVPDATGECTVDHA